MNTSRITKRVILCWFTVGFAVVDVSQIVSRLWSGGLGSMLEHEVLDYRGDAL